jgi:DNA polymerase-4
VREFLAPLPVDVVPGIGVKTLPGLKLRSINTVGDLMARRMQKGSWFEHLLETLLDEDAVYGGPHEPADHSISRDRTFWEDTDDRSLIDAALFTLVEKCCRTLREEKLAASTATVRVRFSDFTTVQRQFTLPSAVTNEEDVMAAARKLLDEVLPEGRRIRLVGIKVSSLSPLEGQQLILDSGKSERLHELHCRVDALRERFGEGSVVWATTAGLGKPPKT